MRDEVFEKVLWREIQTLRDKGYKCANCEASYIDNWVLKCEQTRKRCPKNICVDFIKKRNRSS